MRVREIMTANVVTVSPATIFKDAIELLLTNHVSSLPVVDFDDQFVGIVTETDLLTKEAFPDYYRRPSTAAAVSNSAGASQDRWTAKADGASVGELMSTDVVICVPGEDVHVVARRMLRNEVHQLPVVVDGKLIGIVSRYDILATFDRSDKDIESEVRLLIDNSLWIPQGQARVSVMDGVVTLYGTVRYHSDITILSHVVANVRGVVDVINRLTALAARPLGEAKGNR
jgi:CBS domain-containing protein